MYNANNFLQYTMAPFLLFITETGATLLAESKVKDHVKGLIRVLIDEDRCEEGTLFCAMLLAGH